MVNVFIIIVVTAANASIYSHPYMSGQALTPAAALLTHLPIENPSSPNSLPLLQTKPRSFSFHSLAVSGQGNPDKSSPDSQQPKINTLDLGAKSADRTSLCLRYLNSNILNQPLNDVPQLPSSHTHPPHPCPRQASRRVEWSCSCFHSQYGVGLRNCVSIAFTIHNHRFEGCIHCCTQA